MTVSSTQDNGFVARVAAPHESTLERWAAVRQRRIAAGEEVGVAASPMDGSNGGRSSPTHPETTHRCR